MSKELKFLSRNGWFMFKKKNRFILSGILGVFLFLNACSEITAFVDSRREAGQTEPIGQSRPDKPAVCYNPIWDKDEKVFSLAEAVCAEQGKTAERTDTLYFNCRFMTPNTAVFTCRSK